MDDQVNRRIRMPGLLRRRKAILLTRQPTLILNDFSPLDPKVGSLT